MSHYNEFRNGANSYLGSVLFLGYPQREFVPFPIRCSVLYDESEPSIANKRVASHHPKSVVFTRSTTFDLRIVSLFRVVWFGTSSTLIW
jgi:hypothetical protein